MHRLRLAILGASPCHHCVAACCKQNGHEFSVLLRPDEYGRFAPFAIDVPIDNGRFRSVEKVLPYRRGRCVFLGDDDRCTIYHDRPGNCRDFECVRFFHHQGGDMSCHGEFLQRNPIVTKLLDEM